MAHLNCIPEKNQLFRDRDIFSSWHMEEIEAETGWASTDGASRRSPAARILHSLAGIRVERKGLACNKSFAGNQTKCRPHNPLLIAEVLVSVHECDCENQSFAFSFLLILMTQKLTNWQGICQNSLSVFKTRKMLWHHLGFCDADDIWMDCHNVRLPLRTERQNRNMVSTLMCFSLAPETRHNIACGNRYAHWNVYPEYAIQQWFPTFFCLMYPHSPIR